jgi:N-acyl-D-amino-acid deacylase
MHDLVISGGTVVDGTGAPTRTADIAITNGIITEVGRVDGQAKQRVDADGLVVAPGWVDIHTHYDGQVTWDPEVSPSSWHGATTVVMGNCGVGFAPRRPGGEQFLIELMEGVEDIPGSALNEGITWNWESFPEYLDAVDAMPRVLDVAAQVPHCALRAYVMGERAHDEPSVDEIGQMARLTEEALRAGAVGFSTSRTILHRSKHGAIPGTTAMPDELVAIGEVIGKVGRRVVELVGDDVIGPEERGWMLALAGVGATVTFALAQGVKSSVDYRGVLNDAASAQAAGLQIVPQVANRPTGMLFGFQSSLHPFLTHPTYKAIAHLPLDARIAELRRPEVRAALLAEQPATKNRIGLALMGRFELFFPLGDVPDYEPHPSTSAAAVAAASGQTPQEVMLDWMLARDGKALIFAPLASYTDGDHEAIREMITHPTTVMGLSDGGAHCGLICDASMPTYLLTHWARDRYRGPKLSLEAAVRLQTGRTASVFGFHDRGELVPGKRADINLIDLDNLQLHEPEMVFDLPAGGRRLIQKVDGYRATFVLGQQTFADGVATGVRPGRLVRAGTR